jgi:hypothetical protein
MDNSLFSKENREHLEHELFKQMKAAEQAYCAASAEHAKLKANFGVLSHPTGSQAVYLAAENEQLALENYIFTLEAFTDLILRRPRVPAADRKS